MDVMQLRRSLLMQQIGGGGLPAEYQQVEYITSTGGAYFDLPTMSFGVGDKIKSHIKTQYLGSLTNNFWLSGNGSVIGGIQYEYGYFGRWWWRNVDFTDDTITEIIVPTSTSSVFEVEWEHEYTSAASNFVYRVFQRRGFSAETTDRAMWFLQLFKNGTQLHDLVPCYRKSDNVVGMYDMVGNVFYTNAGTGEFNIPT